MGTTEVKDSNALADAFANAAQRRNFFFEPPSRLQLVEKLEHLNRFSDFLLLVTGPEGAGKTRLLSRLAEAESDRTLRICRVDAKGSGTLSALLRALSEQLSPEIVAGADNQQTLNGIYEYAQVMAAEHIQWVVLIDNGELLDSGSLKLLLQMAGDSQGLAQKPHLLIAGDDSLRLRLEQIDEFKMLEAQVHQLVLEPFSEAEAFDYLKQRYSAATSLSDKQLTAIYQASGGFPGALNAQAEQLFRSGSVSRSVSTTGMPKNLLTVAAVVLLLVLGGALWQFWPSSPAGKGDRTLVQLEVPLDGEKVVEAETAAPVTDIRVHQPATFTPGQDKELQVQPTTESSKVVGSENPSYTGPAEGTKNLPAERIAQSGIAVDEAAGKALAAVPTESVVTQSGGQSVTEDTSRSVVAGISETADPVKKTAEPGSPSTPQAEKTVSQSAVEPPVVDSVADSGMRTEPQPAQKQTAPAQKKAEIVVEQSQEMVLTTSEKELLSWPSSGYTLQVLGAGRRSTAERFVSSRKEPQKFYLFSSTYKNKPWYVVVYGQYKSRAAASEASKQLPAELAELKPWPRSIQGIQAELSARK